VAGSAGRRQARVLAATGVSPRQRTTSARWVTRTSAVGGGAAAGWAETLAVSVSSTQAIGRVTA
jgi:hypothetical protein